MAAGAVLTSLSVLAGATPAPDDRFYPRRGHLDLLSSAQPGPAAPELSDLAVDVRSRAAGRSIKVDAGATSSAVCDGCTGRAGTVQVVYLRRARTVKADNVATAWSQGCTNCGASAVSIQVVMAPQASVLVPNNRSLALNAACATCTTTAAAYQVVVADNGGQLSEAARQELEALVADLRQDLGGVQRAAKTRASASRERSAAESGLRRVEAVVSRDLDTAVLGSRASIDLG
ncbi:MAG: hypothetical protein ACLGIF_08170 [Actinomycetes bacterium]